MNPPFDDQFGAGGREEVAFLRQAIDQPVHGGSVVLVTPVNQVFGRNPMGELLDEMMVRARLVGHWTTSRIAVRVQQGLRVTAENVNGTNELLDSVDEEEDHENIVVLEDEIDD